MELNDTSGGEGTGAATGSAEDILGGGTGTGAGAGASGAEGAGGEGAGGEGAGGAGDPTGADPDWYTSLSAEADGENASNRDWIKAKGFKDLDGVTKALRSAEKAIHDSGRVKVPSEGATAEEIAAFNKAIGVPDDPKGYKLPSLKDAEGNDVKFDTGKLEGIAAIAHKHGIPAKALEATLQEIAEGDMHALAETEADLKKRAAAHADKWGAERDAKLGQVDAAAKALGLTRDEMLKARVIWGPERALDLFAKLGAGISEDTLLTGDTTKAKFGISGAEAQRTLDSKKADATWRSKAMTPGTAENAEYNRLNDAIAAEADRKQREAV